MSQTLQSIHLADIAKNKKTACFFEVFAMLAMSSCSQLALKINKKSLKKRSKNHSLFAMIFWSIFHWFWRPRWDQNPPKIDQKSFRKNNPTSDRFFDRFLIDLGPQLGPKISHQTPHLEPRRDHLGRNLGQLGHKWDGLDSLDQELR